VTSPASGAIVSGTLSVTATASDNVGVIGVRFYVDTAPIGVEQTIAPYTVTWDSSTVSNGTHMLTAVARDAAGNTTTSATVTVSVANGQSPFKGTPSPLPGRIEAEDFDRGGEGIAYHDNTPGNQGGYYRTSEDVDIINPYANGYVVNNFETGEWLSYTVSVAQSGTYKIQLLVSSMYSNSRFHLEIDGVNVTGTQNVPNSGSWGSFMWVGPSGVNLTAGQHVLKVVAEREYFNFDAISASLETAATTSSSPKRRATRPH